MLFASLTRPSVSGFSISGPLRHSGLRKFSGPAVWSEASSLSPLSRPAATSLLSSPFLQPGFLQRRKSASGCVHSSALSSQASPPVTALHSPAVTSALARTALVLPPPDSLLGAVRVFRGRCASLLCTSCPRWRPLDPRHCPHLCPISPSHVFL